MVDYNIQKQNEDLYLIPKNQEHLFTLIWLHGLGDSAQGFLPLFQYKNQSPCCSKTKIVLLTAPIQAVTINMGMQMPSWYDIRDFQFSAELYEKVIDTKQVQKSAQRILQILQNEISILNGNSKRVFLGGFSQGGSMSLYVGLQFEKPLGGILAYSCFLFPDIVHNESNKQTPILIYHGLEDPLIPYEKIKQSYDCLYKNGRQVNCQLQKGLSHNFDEKAITFLAEFWKKNAKI